MNSDMSNKVAPVSANESRQYNIRGLEIGENKSMTISVQTSRIYRLEIGEDRNVNGVEGRGRVASIDLVAAGGSLCAAGGFRVAKRKGR
jgi:hypothetical protein